MFINIDLGQAENRIVAYVAGATKMIECFEKGIDVHKRSASGIFLIPENEISDEEGSAPDIGSGAHSQRFWGKKANHALNYNETPFGFALIHEISKPEAERIYNAYHSLYPEIHDFYYTYVEQTIRETRLLPNLFGRKFFFTGDVMSQKIMNQAYSFIPQSTVADKINEQGLEYIYYNDEFFDIEILNQVHDSIMLQTPINEDNVEEKAKKIIKICESLETPLRFKTREFVIPADVSIGYNAGKYKKEVNDFGLREISYENVGGLANQLYELYRKYRTS